ncbi:MAG: hypothetical protein H7Y13_13640 [Sphingobacteriaceae bacterium]|nr:hypothetical protein [Sphingobacteriaceae bacterium]
MESRCFKFLFLCAILLGTASLRAQTRYLTKTVSITIPTVLDLQLSSGSSLNFIFDTSTKLDNGIELLTATTLTYRSNQAWFVTIQSVAANFSGGQGTMPASVLQFKKNVGGTYAPLSNSPLSLSGTTGAKNLRGTSTIGVDYFMNPGFVYEPALDYSLDILFTISNL